MASQQPINIPPGRPVNLPVNTKPINKSNTQNRNTVVSRPVNTSPVVSAEKNKRPEESPAVKLEVANLPQEIKTDILPVRRLLNFQRSPPDSRDFIIKTNKNRPPKLDPVCDLSSFCTNVKDQGEVGSCTAFGTVGAAEYIHKRCGGLRGNDLLSERFTYYATRVRVAKWSAFQDSGAYVRDAIKSIVKFGCCLESTFPYNGDYSTAPNPAANAEALKYQAVAYAKYEDGATPLQRQTTIEALKTGLSNGMPIVVGFTCYSNIWSAVKGVIPPANRQVIGGHCVLLVGYDDNNKWFKFKNSWSTSWGDRGYGYLPYSYYLSGDMSDCWSIYQVENNDAVIGLSVVNPTNIKAQVKTSVVTVLNEIIAQLDNLLDTIESPE